MKWIIPVLEHESSCFDIFGSASINLWVSCVSRYRSQTSWNEISCFGVLLDAAWCCQSVLGEEKVHTLTPVLQLSFSQLWNCGCSPLFFNLLIRVDLNEIDVKSIVNYYFKASSHHIIIIICKVLGSCVLMWWCLARGLGRRDHPWSGRLGYLHTTSYDMSIGKSCVLVIILRIILPLIQRKNHLRLLNVPIIIRKCARIWRTAQHGIGRSARIWRTWWFEHARFF